MLARIKAALLSGHPVQRLSHFIFAKVLFSLPQSVRRRLFYGTAHYCPICESHLRQFIVLHRAYHLWCPVCRSLRRHRLVWLFFVKQQLLIRKPQRMLHIAPEPGLSARFSEMPGLEYISMDLNDPTAMVKMDIAHIEYPDDSFDLIYCSHVLEHVPDDRQALCELWRVLKPGGHAVILVPITVAETFEDLSVTDPVERERLFGQLDHVRAYGSDVQRRIEHIGFKCETFKEMDIVEYDDIDYLGLSKDETIFFCEK